MEAPPIRRKKVRKRKIKRTRTSESMKGRGGESGRGRDARGTSAPPEQHRDVQLPESLEREIERLGLSLTDLFNTDLHDTRTLAKAESAQILSKQYLTRHRVKNRMLTQQSAHRRRVERNRVRRVETWKAKTEASPFHKDLVAEHERIDEENRIRYEEADQRKRAIAQRMEAAKNEIVLQALNEASDLDALRREKRAILEEERRIKALLDLEKLKSHRKKDLLAAQRAERQRRGAKLEYRRTQLVERLENVRAKDHELLKIKLDVPEEKPSTFQTWDTDCVLPGMIGADAEDEEDYYDDDFEA
mmetsp:Transcript_7735/g.22328  ORF Transcript_7735/g.22328 Transcript_7735/m.22328 type:complete len:303 (-) Transcript_7735:248-1156(-)